MIDDSDSFASEKTVKRRWLRGGRPVVVVVFFFLSGPGGPALPGFFFGCALSCNLDVVDIGSSGHCDVFGPWF